MSERGTRLTALMAGHGLTFVQVYNFFVNDIGGLSNPRFRLQIAGFFVVMMVGVISAYASLALSENRRATRNGLEAFSAILLVVVWIALAYTLANMT